MDSDSSDNIRRLPNGSLDLVFYVSRSRRLRSRAAHRGLRKIGRSMRQLWTEPFRLCSWVVAALRWRLTRLIATATHELRETGGHYALCTACIGVGQGIAVVLERV